MKFCDNCGGRDVRLVPCGDHYHYLCKECEVKISPIPDKPN